MTTVRWRLGGLWQHPNFVKLWAAQLISLSGSQVSALAVPLTATLTLSATSTQMGIQNMLWTGGAFLAALFAGPWIDRISRRSILIGADLGRGVLAVSIPVAATIGILHIEQLYVVAFLFSVLTVFFDIAQMSFLPALIQKEHLVDGNSKLQASRSVVSIAGPNLAGVLVQLLTAPIAMIIDAVSFFCSAFLLRFIQVPEPAAKTNQGQQRLWKEMREGFQIVLRDPVLRSLAASSATVVFFLQVFFTLRVLYLVRDLDIAPVAIGVLSGIGSLAGFLGAVVAGKSARRFGRGPVIVGGMLLSGMGNLLLPLANGSAATILLFLGCGALLDGLGGPIYNINALSLRQTVTPDHMHGRVNATMRFLAISATPISAILSGVASDIVGVRLILMIAGIGQIFACLWIIYSPVWTLKRN